MRLNRFLAAAGLGSRRACDELIRQGRIEINGETAVLPGPDVDPALDRVRCDGERLKLPRKWFYLALHKPPGVLTTLADERDRPCITELLGPYRGKVFPVGRLDRASEGLLLLTNNGELAQRLMHPRYRQERTYLVWLRPRPSLEQLRQVAQGIQIGLREQSGPAKVRLLAYKGEVGKVRITLREGKNREVRRIFSQLGCQVMTLRRVSYAGISLGGLPVGSMRLLMGEEVRTLGQRTHLDL